jgi:hypothetical protein
MLVVHSPVLNCGKRAASVGSPRASKATTNSSNAQFLQSPAEFVVFRDNGIVGNIDPLISIRT